MKGSQKIVVAAITCVATLTAATACTPTSRTPAPEPPSCSQLLTAAIAYDETGTGDVDAILQSLGGNCSNEYEIAVDYLANASPSEFRDGSCEQLIDFGMREEAVALLDQNGHCRFGQAEVPAQAKAPAAAQWPEGGLGWDRARAHAGSVQRVCGPLMSARETADGTFVNVGKDYPAADRFTFIFWDTYLEPIEPGATICGRGEIYLYDGVVAQMEMWDPSALEIWR